MVSGRDDKQVMLYEWLSEDPSGRAERRENLYDKDE